MTPGPGLDSYIFILYRETNYEIFFLPVPVCAITASGVPGGTLVSMNRFSILRVISLATGVESEGVNMTE
jgi:hypothetical protein